MEITQNQVLKWSKVTDSKSSALLDILRAMESVVVAYSGGMDSSFLTAAAHHALGHRVLAVTALSPTFPARDRDDAIRQAQDYGWQHRLIETKELENARFAENPPDRCYYCKKELFEQLRSIAATEGFLWVIDGSVSDDLKDYRPGAKAKSSCGVRSPLQEAGFSKTNVRAVAYRLGLPTAAKPASACLASRFPYGTRITSLLLDRVARAEDVLHRLGFASVRVRIHGEVARIEIDPQNMLTLLAHRKNISNSIKGCGFKYVTLDIDGYRTGSMNEVLSDGSGK